MNRRNLIILIVLTIILFVGISISLYPYWVGYNTDAVIEHTAADFCQRSMAYKSTPNHHYSISTSTESTTASDEPVFPELLKAMEDYNNDIYKHEQSSLSDPWSYQAEYFALDEFGIDDEIVGVLDIPKINVFLPIFLGASLDHLNRGSAQLTQTSMPIGGKNTNCVIAAHRGWNNSDFLLNIEQLEIGDQVDIVNLWQTLHYRVSEIKLIYPDDIDSILIQPGKDLLTLFTCHPYLVNTFRYLVICERVADVENDSVLPVKNTEMSNIPDLIENPDGTPFVSSKKIIEKKDFFPILIFRTANFFVIIAIFVFSVVFIKHIRKVIRPKK